MSFTFQLLSPSSRFLGYQYQKWVKLSNRNEESLRLIRKHLLKLVYWTQIF